MAIVDLYSKRQKRLRGEMSDIYTYDTIPVPLRVQIVHIWNDTLGSNEHWDESHVVGVYTIIVKELCREYGLFRLPNAHEHGTRNYIQELTSFFLAETDTEKALDAIELSFQKINKFVRDWDFRRRQDGDELADAALKELNERFKEHAVGYQFDGNHILRMDSEWIHVEVVKPAIRLLNQEQYAGAQVEFFKAHEHYRHRNTKEALNECLKAFESLMKSICEKRKWQYPDNATAKTLIDVCLKNDLIPSFWQQHFNSLRSMLESSIPTGRNRLAGHGQGTEASEVPDYLAAYMLHMTASAIVFLDGAESAMQ